jgi:hypothetical protein
MSSCGWLVQDLDLSAPPHAPMLFAVAVDDPYEAERVIEQRLKRRATFAATLMELPKRVLIDLDLAPGQFAKLDYPLVSESRKADVQAAISVIDPVAGKTSSASRIADPTVIAFRANNTMAAQRR